MAVPTYPSAITIADIQTEFGGSNPISLDEYYSGGAYVGSGIANSTGTVIPTSGAITFLNFSGAVAWAADPIQPAVTQTYWHGKPSWTEQTPGAVIMTRTGDVYQRAADGITMLVLDGSGTKIYSNTVFSQSGRRWSWKNPNRTWIWTYNSTDRSIFQKVSNTGVMLAASNLAWNSVTGNTPYTWDMAVTSGSSNTTTSFFPILTSNTNSSNATTTIAKVNATDMKTIEWKKRSL